MITRALLSVYDKNEIVEFAQELIRLNIAILSTGGTYTHLKQNGIEVEEIAQYTQFPEILDGRVKTLHPKIYGGILADRNKHSHQQQLNDHNIFNIDLVCVNLYPFAATISDDTKSHNDAIENIDIGGPALLRAAAKNYNSVIVTTDPQDYFHIITKIKQQLLTQDFRKYLAQKAFAHTAAYDSLISNYLAPNQSEFPAKITLNATKIQDLRYGENPHQSAAFYHEIKDLTGLFASNQQLQGKTLSFNNVIDGDSAWECIKSIKNNACVIVKHTNPCGVALADDLAMAYQKAFACDPSSAFGGVIAFNAQVDDKCAQLICQQFIEMVIAPEYSASALTIFALKDKIRILKIKLKPNPITQFDFKKVGGGFLLQQLDLKTVKLEQLTSVTSIPLDADILHDLSLAWQVVRYVKSNAIVLVKAGRTIGISGGQTSRIEACTMAINKALANGFNLEDAVVASEAFFPFKDNVELLAQYGIRAIVQPGGSIRDTEIIASAKQHKMVMLFTNYRVFKH